MLKSFLRASFLLSCPILLLGCCLPAWFWHGSPCRISTLEFWHCELSVHGLLVALHQCREGSLERNPWKMVLWITLFVKWEDTVVISTWTLCKRIGMSRSLWERLFGLLKLFVKKWHFAICIALNIWACVHAFMYVCMGRQEHWRRRYKTQFCVS